MLHKRLATTNNDWWEYMWTNLLEFDWTNFYDWDVRLNWNRTNEYELQQYLYNLLEYET